MQEEIRTHLKQDKLNSYNSIQGKKISNYKLFQRVSWRRDHKRRLHEPLKKFCVTYRIYLIFVKKLQETKRFERFFSIAPEIL